MTVIDTSGVVDYLLDDGVAREVEDLMVAEGELVAPDLLVFEVLAVLRREALRGRLSPTRTGQAVENLGDLSLELMPSLAQRERAWELRHNFRAADAIFIALAEQLGEALATKDAGLVSAAGKHTEVHTRQLGRGG